jgi:hypothetical protein
MKDGGIPCGAGHFANPTGAVGLSAVNGAASTAMRSDAAPPLSAGVQSALTGTTNLPAFGTGAFGYSTRALVGADLPTPGASSLGGVQSVSCLPAQLVSAISTSGVPSCTVPVATMFNVLTYGAAGNGTTDDTTAVQNAINAAQAVGGIVFFPAGSYKITTGLSVTARVSILGVGYQASGGTAYPGQQILATTGYLASVLVCSTTINCLTTTTDQAVRIEKIQITYPTSSDPSTGTTALTMNAAAGSTHANIGSVIKDVLIAGVDNGVALNNLYNFVVDNIQIINQWQTGITVTSPNYNSQGDSTITNSTFWGNGVSGHSYHLTVQSGGGLRVVNNKFNFGGTNTNCILINPNLAVAQSMEPLVITGNSMEGCNVGVNFNNSNVANATISQVDIAGNQIWATTSTVFVNTNGTARWLGGLNISGNVLQVVGGANKTAMRLDNLTQGIISGNTFSCSGGCTTSTGIVLAANTDTVQVVNNEFFSGYSTQVNNSGSGNTVALPVNNGGTGDTGTAWAAFTPAPNCGTATFTTTSGRSKTLGKTTWVEMDMTFTALGTCTNALTFNLPNTAQSAGSMAGRENAVSGKTIGCSFLAGATTGQCTPADAASFANGYRLLLSGVYENQ